MIRLVRPKTRTYYRWILSLHARMNPKEIARVVKRTPRTVQRYLQMSKQDQAFQFVDDWVGGKPLGKA